MTDVWYSDTEVFSLRSLLAKLQDNLSVPAWSETLVKVNGLKTYRYLRSIDEDVAHDFACHLGMVEATAKHLCVSAQRKNGNKRYKTLSFLVSLR